MVRRALTRKALNEWSHTTQAGALTAREHEPYRTTRGNLTLSCEA